MTPNAIFEWGIWFLIILAADVCAVEWELRRRKVETNANIQTLNVLKQLYKDKIKHKEKKKAKQIKALIVETQQREEEKKQDE